MTPVCHSMAQNSGSNRWLHRFMLTVSSGMHTGVNDSTGIMEMHHAILVRRWQWLLSILLLLFLVVVEVLLECTHMWLYVHGHIYSYGENACTSYYVYREPLHACLLRIYNYTEIGVCHSCIMVILTPFYKYLCLHGNSFHGPSCKHMHVIHSGQTLALEDLEHPSQKENRLMMCTFFNVRVSWNTIYYVHTYTLNWTI